MACFHVDYFRSCLGGVGVDLSLPLWKGVLILSCLSSFYGKDKLEFSVCICVKFVYEDVSSSYSQSELFHMGRYALISHGT